LDPFAFLTALRDFVGAHWEELGEPHPRVAAGIKKIQW
jgi:hypothetical protein